MKKFMLPVIIVALLIVLLKIINLGALTMNIIEKTAHVDINYRMLKGNIFQGYKITTYNVKISDTDSIFGETAEIRYHFKPFVFRLPSLFQINLIEPTICITKKQGEQEEAEFSLLRLNLGLRINLKNGRIVFKNEKKYVIERISGLIYIDFLGDKIFLNTMNLSLKTQDYPIHITSANLNIGIDNQMVDIKSFSIKGRGITLNGKGTYSLEQNEASLNFKSASINLETIGIHEGTVTFSGNIAYKDGNLLPRIQGATNSVYPFDRFKFETASSIDTIWVNVFDGELFNGTFFSQIKIMNLEELEFETNFKQVNVGNFVNIERPIFINGYIGYRDKKIVGFINSPTDQGVGIDSLFIYGTTTESSIHLDSLFVKEGKRTLQIDGKIYSTCDLNITFDNFNLERFAKYFPLKGTLKGKCCLQGDLKKPLYLTLTSNLSGNNFSYGDFSVEKFTLLSREFQLTNPNKSLSLTLENPSFKKFDLLNVMFSIEENNFLIDAEKQNNTLKIAGTLEKIWRGTISFLNIQYNEVKTQSKTPISFDVLKKELGKMDISFIGGTLRGTVSPMSIVLSDGNLEKLGMILGLKEHLSGTLQLSLSEKNLSINAHGINFRGLQNGSLIACGERIGNDIHFDTLMISDEKNQKLFAHGLLSPEESNIHTKFSDVGVWPLFFLHNFMRNPDGLLSGEGTIKGNINDFSLQGKGELKNGSFGIEVISAQFDSVTSRITLDGNLIIFETGQGLISTIQHSNKSRGEHGARVTGGGVVKLEPRFGANNLNFDFSFKDAPIQYQPFVFGIGSGNFSVGMKDRVMYYNGNITVKEGIVPIEFGIETLPEEDTGEEWTMNLKVKGERNIWLRNRDADIEFEGELYIIKEHGPLYITGNLETHRGNYYWLNHILSITTGKVTFIPEEEIDAELDIWGELDTREDIKIILHLFGTMSEPIFEFFTDPPGEYSEQDIITYLNLNITWQELESMKSGEYVGKILPQTLLLWLESDVSRRIRRYTGLDYFIIEGPFLESEEKAKVTVGKYISKDLFITYTYGVTTFSNEFNVEYFIDDKNEILIRKDEEGEYSLQYRYRIRF